VGLGREIEDAGIDQPVMDQHVRLPERLDGANGEQARVARAGADENHAPARGGIEECCHAGEMGPAGAVGNGRLLGEGVGKLSRGIKGAR